MVVRRIFSVILSFSVCGLSLGTLIDPQSTAASSHRYVHCLSTNGLVQIKDPFSPSVIQDPKFIAMEWYKLQANGNETLLLQFLVDEKKTPLPKFSIYDFWGLQMNNVDLSDTATYKAKLVHLNSSHNREWSAQITFAVPPELKSEKLFVSINRNVSSVIISCGHIATMGMPPISIMVKASNGTVLPSVYRNGYMELTVSEKEAEEQKITCEVDSSSPAFHCVPEKDLARWHGAFTRPSTAQSSDMVAIIIGVVVGAVVLTVIITIIVVIVVKRRKKGKTYNAKDHEREREDELNQNRKTPLLQDHESQYDLPSVKAGPIYKGPVTPSPYMVSKVYQGSAGSILKNTKLDPGDKSYVNGDKSPQLSSGKFIKRGDEKNRKLEKEKTEEEKGESEEGKKEQKPPKTKPRSIFLSASMEELDKLNQAIASGDGSRLGGPAGTQV